MFILKKYLKILKDDKYLGYKIILLNGILLFSNYDIWVLPFKLTSMK